MPKVVKVDPKGEKVLENAPKVKKL